VSELRSVLEAWEAEDPRGLADAGVEEGFAELHRASERLEALKLRWLGELDRRQAWAQDGYLSTASWLKRRFRVAGGTAAGEVRLARSLAEMPRASEALGEGTVSMGAVKVLAAAREADPGAYGESEEVLVAAARDLDLSALGRVVTYWRHAALDAGDGPGSEQALAERRRLHVSPTVFGMVRIDGDLDPETGENVLVALRAVLDAEARSLDPEDYRTPAQRRADALGVLARGWLDTCDRGVVAGERPHLSVIVDLPTLAGLREPGAPGGRCELEHAGPVDPELVRRLGCDAAVSRVVVGPDAMPLDVGRRTKVVPGWIRRALVVRDGCCRFPACDRPPTWCDPHHVRHWVAGGVTALSNLVLLCRRHHRLVHAKRFDVDMMQGRPVFRRPDGSVLEDRAPP
jgi:hypothetical protein